ncbi:hypothetical protein [Muricoccus aerilatus]|uniref:hypothetical protein n=1 Tax=Muricoccus aerilatus TaxID=452982 RepID=UPI0012EC8040|nr:hypothetical protein [Roseomonas aerilata]
MLLRSRVETFLSDQTNCLRQLSSDGDGLISVDLCVPENLPGAEQIILSASLFQLVNSCLFESTLESKSKLPFTIYKSSADNRTAMKNAGIKFYSPDEKLGFHNDVIARRNGFHIPKYVSLMNLFVGYKDPGNFIYVHKRECPELRRITEKGSGKKFKFRPTPVVYQSQLDAPLEPEAFTEVTAFWETSDGEIYAFSNGELMGKDEEGSQLLADMQSALLACERRIQAPQTLFRAQIFRNDLGFHSRDIFKDQFVFEGATRLFLRAVSKEAVVVP